MSSNLSGSSQQPFANPQPAPVNPAVASPPTKQSLQRWAKWFKPPTKVQETQVAEQPTGIFGVPLRQSIAYANVAISLVDETGKSYIYGYVPIVVAKCGVYLKEKATNVEGIFRLSGSEKRIKELRTIFDSPDRYGKGLDWAGYTVHDAANVLRRYLNQLPEPIVPLALYHPFREPLRGHTMQAVGDSEGNQLPENFDISKAIATYQQLITELPPLNRQLLLYILDLLAVFASKSDENRMNSQNLAAIFQPGLLSHPDHDMAPQEYRLSQDVLIFLIENQDHFLIGMKGTAADEQTVHEVQQGGTPPPGTPTGKSSVKRSSSNASAGADDVRKYGGIRRNISVSSRHSRQSNGAPSPASPAYGTPTSAVQRSNTVPSKRSPAISSSRFQRASGSPSPNNGVFPSMQPENTQNSSVLPDQTSDQAPGHHSGSQSSVPTIGALKLPAPSYPPSTTGEKQPITPTREKPGFFARSPTAEGEKKAPNKLRKKRLPGASNESAQSSTQSLNDSSGIGGSPVIHNQFHGKDRDVDHAPLETIPSASPGRQNRSRSPLSEHLQPSNRPHDSHQNSDQTLKPLGSPTNSLHSHSSFNDLSHSEADDVAGTDQKEKRSRWRLSRRRDDSTSFGPNLTPRKNFGSDAHAAASSSSIGSAARPRKSFTGDSNPVGSESTLVNTHQSSNESGSAHVSEEKKGPLGWIKNKMREKREEREAERERNKSPPATSDRTGTSFGSRSKSVETRREEISKQNSEQPSIPPLPTTPQSQTPQPLHQPPMQSIDEISTSQVLVPEKRLSQTSTTLNPVSEKRLSQQSHRSHTSATPKFHEGTEQSQAQGQERLKTQDDVTPKEQAQVAPTAEKDSITVSSEQSVVVPTAHKQTNASEEQTTKETSENLTTQSQEPVIEHSKTTST